MRSNRLLQKNPVFRIESIQNLIMYPSCEKRVISFNKNSYDPFIDYIKRVLYCVCGFDS